MLCSACHQAFEIVELKPLSEWTDSDSTGYRRRTADIIRMDHVHPNFLSIKTTSTCCHVCRFFWQSLIELRGVIAETSVHDHMDLAETDPLWNSEIGFQVFGLETGPSFEVPLRVRAVIGPGREAPVSKRMILAPQDRKLYAIIRLSL